MRPCALPILIVAALSVACSSKPEPPAGADASVPEPVLPQIDFSKLEDGTTWAYTETRAPCASHVETKQVFFGDLHSHTGFSFDAWAYGNRADPATALRYAQGEAIPFEGGVHTVQLTRPLDFAAVSDHAEFLGEVALCTVAGHPAYDSSICQTYRGDPETAVVTFGLGCAALDPQRMDLCSGEANCLAPALSQRWQAIQKAAEEADDKTAACRFTAFVAYEYTATPHVNNLHRLVVFRNAHVPEIPTSHYEAPTAWHLWASLMSGCLSAGTGCDVMTLAHNTNLASGAMFAPEPAGTRTKDELAYRAQVRRYLEPLLEVHQQKGTSECRNGIGTTAADPACDFEQQWPAGAADCGETVGSFGMRLEGCTSKYDYARGILLEGLSTGVALGIDPYVMAFVASTDTHNATPGRVEESDYEGHVGIVDDTAAKRFGTGNATHDTYINNPGGLTAVWAEENSRDAIFSALRRREVYATSGPRLKVRLFGGWSYPAGTLADPGWETLAYAGGVPMGGLLPTPAGSSAPVFLVWAEADGASSANRLEEAQMVKGWLDAQGQPHESVTSLLKSPLAGGAWDSAKCAANLNGEQHLWKVWSDPTFDPSVPSFYYLRVLEAPSCRWSSYDCLRTTGADRPALCDDPSRLVAIQERAWTSPIWYLPK